MQYNYSHDNDGPGYGIYQFSGARAFHDNTVRYNVSENDARKNSYGAIDFWNGRRQGISNVNVYNNTVYLTPAASGTPRGHPLQVRHDQRPRPQQHLPDDRRPVHSPTSRASRPTCSVQGNDYWSSGSPFKLKVAPRPTPVSRLRQQHRLREDRDDHGRLKNVDPLLASPSTIPTVGIARIDASRRASTATG